METAPEILKQVEDITAELQQKVAGTNDLVEAILPILQRITQSIFDLEDRIERIEEGRPTRQEEYPGLFSLEVDYEPAAVLE